MSEGMKIVCRGFKEMPGEIELDPGDEFKITFYNSVEIKGKYEEFRTMVCTIKPNENTIYVDKVHE